MLRSFLGPPEGVGRGGCVIEFVLIVVFCVLGVLMGVVTGLLPGLHVNNIALILLSLSGGIVGGCGFLFSYGVSEEFILLLISGFIVSVSISHTFHDVIPTTFIGAPEEDTALAVLPAHELLLKGRGYDAVVLSAMGSYGAVVVCLVLLYGIRFVVGSPLFLYETLQEIMPWVLIAISLLMLGTEKTMIPVFGRSGRIAALAGMGFATFVFLLSGVFGLVILDFELWSPVGLDAPVLFPALAGLFGMPTLVTSLMTQPVIPPQRVEKIRLSRGEQKSSAVSVVTGSLAGVLVSIIPGITSSTGTILAMNARQKSSNRQTIVTLSSVNTACSFTVVAMLFIILRARSGAAIAVQELVMVDEWLGMMMPVYLVYLLMFLVLGGGLSYFSTIVLAKVFARRFAKVRYSLLVGMTILMVLVLVVVFTGVMGVVVLVAATLIGFLPVLWGVRRSHCMGVLLVPIILHFL